MFPTAIALVAPMFALPPLVAKLEPSSMLGFPYPRDPMGAIELRFRANPLPEPKRESSVDEARRYLEQLVESQEAEIKKLKATGDPMNGDRIKEMEKQNTVLKEFLETYGKPKK